MRIDRSLEEAEASRKAARPHRRGALSGAARAAAVVVDGGKVIEMILSSRPAMRISMMRWAVGMR